MSMVIDGQRYIAVSRRKEAIRNGEMTTLRLNASGCSATGARSWVNLATNSSGTAKKVPKPRNNDR